MCVILNMPYIVFSSEGDYAKQNLTKTLMFVAQSATGATWALHVKSQFTQNMYQCFLGDLIHLVLTKSAGSSKVAHKSATNAEKCLKKQVFW